jgi:hypothetical protein
MPTVFVDLHLVDAGQNIFHRVFDGDDFAVGPVDEMQAGIKRRRLAGTGRAGDEQDAVRQRDDALERLLVVLKNPSSGRPSFRPSLSKIRMTMLSP